MGKQANKQEGNSRESEIERMAEASLRRELAEAGTSQDEIDKLFMEEVDGEGDFEEESEGADSEGNSEAPEVSEPEEKKEEKLEDIRDRKVKAKIDGVEEDVSIETLLRTYQINKSADKRLQEAAAKERELEERAMRLLELQGNMLGGDRKKAEDAAADSKKKEDLADDDSVRDAIASIFSGDEEASAKKLMDAIDAKVRKETERRIAEERKNMEKMADERIRQVAPEIQTQMLWDTAVSDFVSSNKQIFEDPVLANLWKSNLEDFAEKGLSPKEATESAGKSVMDWLGKYAPKAESKPNEPQDDGVPSRKERKDASKKYDVGNVSSKKSQRSESEDDDTPMSTSDYVRMARKARGQA